MTDQLTPEGSTDPSRRMRPSGPSPSPEQIKALYAVTPDPEEVQDYMIRIKVLGMTPDEALQELLKDRRSSGDRPSRSV